jgi:hypothetical protein
MSGLSLVGSETVSLFSSYGFSSDVTSFQRNDAFCSYTVLSNQSSSPSSSDLLLLTDTTTDNRFASSFLVNGSLNIRFYLGIPIIYQHLVVGTLFLMDHIPRTDFSEEKQRLLITFGQLLSEGLISGDDLETNFTFNQTMIQTVIINILHDLCVCHSELTKKHEEFNKIVKFLSNSRKSSQKSTKEIASDSSKHQKLQQVDLLQTAIQELSFSFQESLKSASLIMNCLRNLSNPSTVIISNPSVSSYLPVSEWIRRLKKTVSVLTKSQEASIRWDLDDCDGGWKYPESSSFHEMIGKVLSLSFLLNLSKWKNVSVSVGFKDVPPSVVGNDSVSEVAKETQRFNPKIAMISIELACFHRNTSSSSSSSIVNDDSMISLIEELFVKIMELFSGDFSKASSLSSETLKFSFLSSLQQIPPKPQRKSLFLRNSIVAIVGGLGITSLVGGGNEAEEKEEKEGISEASTVNALANATLSFFGRNTNKSGPAYVASAVRQDSSSNAPSSSTITATVDLFKKETFSLSPSSRHKLEHALTAASSYMGSNNSLPIDGETPQKEVESDTATLKVTAVKKHRRRSTLAMRGKIKYNIISSIIDSVAGNNGNLRKSTIVPSN